MGWWDDNQQNYDQYNQAVDGGNHSSMGHEVIAGGAAFGAMKMFEDHQRKEGKVVNHKFAKEIIAGFAGAEIDKLAETKGEDWFDREKAEHAARKQATNMYDEHYGQYDQYDPQQQRPHPQMQQYGNW